MNRRIFPARRIFSILLCTALAVGQGLLLGCSSRTVDADQDTEFTFEEYPASTFYETVSVRGTSFSADESKILLTSDQSGVFNVYAQPVGGGEPVALTRSTTETIMGVSWFPRDDRFLYLADQGGNELDHLYVQELDGSVVDLTPGEGLKAQWGGFSGDKQHFYVATNERDARTFDLYRYQTDGYERSLMFENDGSYYPGEVSDDGKWLSLTKIQSNADSDVYVQNLETGELTHVTPHEGEVQNSAAVFSPDSSKLYYSTNGQGEFTQIWAYDLSTGDREATIAADWDVMSVAFSDSGRYRVSTVNNDAVTELTMIDTESGSQVRLPELPPGDVTSVGFSPSESQIAFYLGSDRSPRNLYVYEIGGESPRQLTRTLNPEIVEHNLASSEVIRYASYDGLEIPAILWRPLQASAAKPVPALVWVHGGPGGQSRRGYDPTIQHLVNHGYAVLAVNNRGSSGYGKTFHHMDDKKHGDVDLRDCVQARTYLESLDWVDGSKVGIAGGSYGGYMVAAALAFEPEVFDVGIDIFGVTNWIRTLKEIPPWWTAQRDSLYSELGNPYAEEERLHSISPLFHASNIVRPLLVVQGANDPRVQQVESDELVAAVRDNGVPVEYVLFDDEGHGFTKKANRIAASEAYLSFLDQHLKAPQASTSEGPT